jgi:hypothetical protein
LAKYTKALPKEKTKKYLDEKKKTEIEKWKKDQAEKIKGKDFEGTITRMCNSAYELIYITRVSIHFILLVTFYSFYITSDFLFILYYK